MSSAGAGSATDRSDRQARATATDAPRAWSAWLAVLGGAAAIPVAWAVLAALGGGVVWLALSGSPRADVARAATVCLAAGGIVAFGLGGWLASRAARSRGSVRGWVGAGSGLVAMALVGALVAVGAGGAFDFDSVGVALGIVPPAVSGVPALPDFLPVTEATVRPPDIAWQRTFATIIYLAVLALLAIGAATLGGFAVRDLNLNHRGSATGDAATGTAGTPGGRRERAVYPGRQVRS